MLFGILALLHARHVAIELRGHIGACDARSEFGQCIDDGDTQLTRLDRIVLEIAHRVKALDDARARRLGAQAALFHLLDELALAIARGRLGLLGLELDIRNVDGIALGKRRHLLIALEAVWVRLAEASIDQHITRSLEKLAGDIDNELGVLDSRRTHERRQEATSNKVVELFLAAVERSRIALARRVDWRVVGGLDLAARGLHRTGQNLFADGSERGVDMGQVLNDAAQIERARIDRVVDTRIADKTRHIERLCNTHGARRRNTDRCRCRLKRRGRKRRGRLLLARAFGHGGHRTGRRILNMPVRGLRSIFIGETRGLVADLETLVLGSTLRGTEALNLPIILRDECHTLTLTLDHEGKRRSLNAAG